MPSMLERTGHRLGEFDSRMCISRKVLLLTKKSHFGSSIGNSLQGVCYNVVGQILLKLRRAAEAAMDDSYVTEHPPPWSRESAFTRYLMVDKDTNGKAKFHQIDPWHMMHLGVGKSWSASGLMLLQEQVDEPNQDLRIAVLSNEYKQFCKRAKLVAHIKKIDRYTLGGGGSNEPNGTWNKASVTSNMLLFLEDYCNRNSEILKGNQQLEIFVPVLHFVFFELHQFSGSFTVSWPPKQTPKPGCVFLCEPSFGFSTAPMPTLLAYLRPRERKRSTSSFAEYTVRAFSLQAPRD